MTALALAILITLLTAGVSPIIAQSRTNDGDAMGSRVKLTHFYTCTGATNAYVASVNPREGDPIVIVVPLPAGGNSECFMETTWGIPTVIVIEQERIAIFDSRSSGIECYPEDVDFPPPDGVVLVLDSLRVGKWLLSSHIMQFELEVTVLPASTVFPKLRIRVEGQSIVLEWDNIPDRAFDVLATIDLITWNRIDSIAATEGPVITLRVGDIKSVARQVLFRVRSVPQERYISDPSRCGLPW